MNQKICPHVVECPHNCHMRRPIYTQANFVICFPTYYRIKTCNLERFFTAYATGVSDELAIELAKDSKGGIIRLLDLEEE